jgi:hypothetical protein
MKNMKKTIFSLVAALFMAGSMSAQIFVGGSIGFGTNSSSTSVGGTSNDGPSSYNFGLSPYGGFYLNDDLAVGSYIGFNVSGGSNNQSPETTWSRSTFNITPFVRYRLLDISNLNIFGQGQLGLGFGGSSNSSGGVTVDGPSVFDFSMAVRPGISYDFSESVAIEAFIGGISFLNRTETTAANNNNPEVKDSSTSFDFDLTSHLSIGFVYKF